MLLNKIYIENKSIILYLLHISQKIFHNSHNLIINLLLKQIKLSLENLNMYQKSLFILINCLEHYR